MALSGLALATAGFVPAPGVQTLKKVASVYNGDLTVLEDPKQGSRYLLAQSRQSLVLQSRIDLGRKQELTMGYFQIMALMTALHPHPDHVFNMGLGGGALPRFHLGRYPKSEVVTAEIDAAVIDLAKEFFYVSDARHRIVEGDGFDTLKMQPGKFDVVWVDTITPKEGPKAYIQARYLNVLRDHLGENGLIVANLGESKNTESFAGVERSYRQGYAHGIRVKSPLLLTDETPERILALLKENSGVRAPELEPSFFVAVGNQEGLNCASFWKRYHEWKAAKSLEISWGTDKAEGVCQDL
jgi:SAM-dependent methyltransferase